MAADNFDIQDKALVILVTQKLEPCYTATWLLVSQASGSTAAGESEPDQRQKTLGKTNPTQKHRREKKS